MEENVKIKTSSAILYDNSSGKTVTIESIDLSDTAIAKNTEKIVDVTLDLTNAEEGFYQSTIILTAETDENFTYTNISVKAKIEAKTLLSTIATIAKNDFVQAVLIIIAVALVSVALLVPEDSKKLDKCKENRSRDRIKRRIHTKEFKVVVTGMFAVLIWAFIIIASSFDTLKTTFSTILIGPFIGFVIGYVNFKRDERKEKFKTATEIRNKGIEKDLDFLRGLIGETTNHYASLKSKYYTEKGVLSRKKWDETSTQGVIIDIPTGRLAKYYRYTELHNKYYLCILKMDLLKGITAESWIKEQLEPKNSDLNPEHIIKNLNTMQSTLLKELAKKNFGLVCRFEHFRLTYAKLEQAIWSNLIFQIGLLGETYLEPLQIDFPRLSRGLLEYLVDKGVLTNSVLEKEANYPLKEKIRQLDPDLFKVLLPIIYDFKMRCTIERTVTKDFDDIYEKLEELSDLPPLPSECTFGFRKED